MIDRITALREQFEQLRPFIRPEADNLAGSMNVALDQALAAAAAEPPPATPIEEQLAAIAADLSKVRSAVVAMSEGQNEIHAAVLAMREGAGL